MHPFILFLITLLLFLVGLTLCIFAVFTAFRMTTVVFDKITFRKLKKIIKKKPSVGCKSDDGYLVFKQGRFAIKYTLTDSDSYTGQSNIQVISFKKRLLALERRMERFDRRVTNFWLYRDWIYFLEPPQCFYLLSIILIILIFYFAVVEPGNFKIYRARWIISRLLKVPIESVEIKSNGWVAISGQRVTAVDKQIENISYYVNPFKWLTFLDDGYIARERGRGYSPVNYPITYDDNRNKIKFPKDDRSVEGEFNIYETKWEEPEGTGIRTEKVLGYDWLRSKDRIIIQDKSEADNVK